MKRYSQEFKESVVRKMMPPDRAASRSELVSGVENVRIMSLSEESKLRKTHKSFNKKQNNGGKFYILIGSLRSGGAEGVCVTLANGLADAGWNVSVVVLNLDGSILQNSIRDDVRLICLNIKHARNAFWKLRNLIKKTQPRGFLVFNHQLTVLLVLIRMLFKENFFILARNINTLSQKRKNTRSIWHKYVVYFLTSLFYGKADCIIAQSLGMKTDLVENLKIKESRIKVIYNPITRKIEEFVRRDKGAFLQKQGYLLCVGRLESVKAFQTAIEVFSLLTPDFPGLRLKIVGTGTLECDLKRLAVSLKIDDRVDFEGFQSNVMPFYLHANAVLLTSIYEGFPNVLIEAIALGTPVVAFDCPSGPQEIIQNGVNGYLVKNQDKAHLLECLKRTLLKDWNSNEIRKTAHRYKSSVILGEYINVLSKYNASE